MRPREVICIRVIVKGDFAYAFYTVLPFLGWCLFSRPFGTL